MPADRPTRQPDSPEPLTTLTIGRSARLLVDDVCTCGGNCERTVWKKPGDLRNRHESGCPAVTVLGRLPSVEEELAAAGYAAALAHAAPEGLDRDALRGALHQVYGRNWVTPSAPELIARAYLRALSQPDATEEAGR